MNINRSRLFVLVGLAVALAAALSGCSPGPAVSLAQGSPQEVVESFYRSYISYPGNALVAGAYRSNEYLTEDFVQKVDETVASLDRGGADPFLCAQDIPGDFTVGEALVAGQTASVVVHQVWNPGTQYESARDLTVALRAVDGRWKIADVICLAAGATSPFPETPLPTTPGQAVQAFYGWYIWYARERGNPLADEAYRSNEYLTEDFIHKVDGIVASFDKGGYDPFLCAQDIPGKFTIGEVVASGETSSVVLNHIWNLGTEYETTSHASVKLHLVDGAWKIVDVWCLE